MKKRQIIMVGIVFILMLIPASALIVKKYPKELFVDRICFPETDVCIQPGTDTWLWLRDMANTTNRNMRFHGTYNTAFNEVAPNVKMIFGYTDTDKFITYDSANDELDIVTDNITLSLENTILEENAYANSIEFGRQKNLAGYVIRTKRTTSSGHMYYEDRYGGSGNAMVNRWRTDGGDQYISNNGATTIIGGNLQVSGNIVVTGCIQYNGGTLGTCV